MTIYGNILQELENNDPSLSTVHLRTESGIDDKDLKEIVQAALKGRDLAVLKKEKIHLNTIIIDVNDITDVGVQEVIKLQHIEKLGLEGNEITDEGAIAIAQHMPNLKQLGLGGNHISDRGAKALAESHLTFLNLYSNNLTNECVQYFLNNTTLTGLLLDNDQIDKKLLEKVEEHIANNRKITAEKENQLAIQSGIHPASLKTKDNFFPFDSKHEVLSPTTQNEIKASIKSQLELLPDNIRKEFLETLMRNESLSSQPPLLSNQQTPVK